MERLPERPDKQLMGPDSSRHWYGWFTRHLGWKLLSVVLAVLLWMVIVRDPELSTLVTAPVMFRGMPQQFEISSALVNSVQLEVRGPSRQVTPESLADVAVILDLGSVERPGDRTYTVEASNVSLPKGVFFSRANPTRIRIHFEQRIVRDLPVRVQVSQYPPEGYQIEQQVVTPELMRVIGPASSVRQLDFVDTDSVNLSTVVGSSEFQVNTHVSDPRVRIEGAPQVRVRVHVQRIP
ncbi:MAG: YbbR-like domain-containing protein [bacterium]|nr:YbbR-like domain-containing protein [bacterium]